MKMISIDEIVVNNKYLRLDTDVESLKMSIDTVGLLHPLVLNQQNELIAGGRRYTALKELEWGEVPVVITERNELEQELISIEENVIRQKLTSVELDSHLRRAKEIYDELFPEVAEDLSAEPIEEESLEVLVAETGKKPFTLSASEKMGISPKAVRAAIQRDIHSSAKIKKAREVGEITAAQANSLIQLEKADQNDILDHVMEMDSAETRRFVKDIQEVGVETAIRKAEETDPAVKEYKKLQKAFKKIAKETKQLLDSASTFSGQEREKAIKEADHLRTVLEEFLSLM